MEGFLNTLLEITTVIADNIWWPEIPGFGFFPGVVVLLAITGIYMSYKTGFIQIRRLGLAIRLMIKGRSKSEMEGRIGDVTPFQALMTALAATVGNGNIAGVATAIASGGPGAPFWMWMTAVFGMATKYAEGMLGLKYRIKTADGTFSGGAMYYLRDGLKNKGLGKFLALWFSIAVILMATFGSGNMAQSNSIALALNSDFGIPFILTGFGLAFITGIVIIGGIKRIAIVAERLVPGMIVIYMGAGFYVILSNVMHVPDILMIVFQSALTNEAIVGGFLGHTVKEAIRFGVARGTLSNESGIGSCSIPAAAAKGNEASAQGMVAMMGTFIDTIIVCSMTTFVILNSNLHPHTTGLTSTELTKSAFAVGLGTNLGGWIVSISSLLFGYTTLLGWSYYGEQGAKYMWGIKSVLPYRYIFCAFVFMGAVLQGEHLRIVWNFGDIGNALMAIPNLIGLILLGGVVRQVTNDYLKRWDEGKITRPFGD
ncbi:MAG: sodium:alanine symporter family protein [Ignavibacteriales bacterium]|nr:sodium:alanine symporter family protein [Ignavibacteriales bacterium]